MTAPPPKTPASPEPEPRSTSTSTSTAKGAPRLVSVAAPVAVDRGFTYGVPASWPEPPAPGVRVLIPFGSRRLIGVVRDAAPEALPPGKTRNLLEILDPEPALPPDLLRLCEWIQDYYLAPVGEAYRLALPGLLTGNDVRSVRISEAGAAALTNPLSALKSGEHQLLSALAERAPKELAVSKLTSLKPKIPRALGVLAELAERSLVEVRWDDGGDESSRTELHLRRTDYLRGTVSDEATLRDLVGRSKQRRGLLDFLESFPPGTWVSLAETRGPFPRARVLLPPLVDAGLVAAEERPRALDPFALGEVERDVAQAPTKDQSQALEQLRERLAGRRFAVALLHGITGSGKTEVYLQTIATALEEGGGAIVLVPEIALTPQLSDRFRARFGDTVAVLHSALTPRQRLDAWQQIRSGIRRIVIGPRSAIFAPIPGLRVIVVDEEHDGSFKQEEGVRYHARDVALVRAREVGALAILGSATPSLETYELARGGRYSLIELNTRPTPRPLPKVELLSLSVHRPNPETMLTGVLRDAVAKTVEAGEQVILFLNRRGFATTLVCSSCSALLPCPDCSAPSMTYHLGRNRLMCHLCGRIEGPPERCPSCGDGELLHGNAGTERIEVALEGALPGVRVLRLDRDTSRGRGLLTTLAKFRAREADVLVGTQMLSKGHDFPGVTLVGILQADHGLGLPDLRAAERTFQLLTQVSGRAGRGERPGRVLIQAYSVKHEAIRFAADHNYSDFAKWELDKRRELGNPPYGFLALIRITGGEADAVIARAEELIQLVHARIETVARAHSKDEPTPLVALGPIPSPIERINKRIRWQILLRGTNRHPLRWLLRALRPHMGPNGSGAAQTMALVDVDPQSLL